MTLTATSRPPQTLPGFEQMKRTWNAKLESWVARILPGEFYVTQGGEGISTTLGSCISACIRDRGIGIGGMNHFMLPESASGESGSLLVAGTGNATRYGNYAMEHLINGIMRNGGRRENLEVKIFGGGRIMEKMTDVGARNIRFVREYLAMEGLKVVAEDVGDIFPRMIVYFPESGKVKVKRLRSLHNNVIADQEKRYIETVVEKPVAGEIELF
jgi:chemotaxis protein CheD